MTTTHQPLQDRTALVTGGSRGIGAAVVRRLTRDGAHVAFTFTSAEDAAAAVAAETGALPLRADSSDTAAVHAAVNATVDHFGGLDVLVNNAGVAGYGMAADFPLDELDRMFAVNVRGVLAAVQAAAPHLRAGGRIITIGSVNADRAPLPGAAAYSMTKAAVAALTRSLARELGPRAITANTVQPGPTETDMNPVDGPASDTLRGLTSLGRYGQAADVAAAVAFLAGPEASFITGATWNVDGGLAV